MVTARITSLNKGWNTPRALFDELDHEFHFVLDAAANDLNHKCPMYYTEKDDALSKSWNVGGAVFVNPPYGRTLGKWVRKAYEESRGGVYCGNAHPFPDGYKMVSRICVAIC